VIKSRACIYSIHMRVYVCAFSYVNIKLFDERLMTFCLVVSFFILIFFVLLKVFFLYNEYVVWSINNSSSCSYFHFSLTYNYYSIQHLLVTVLFCFLYSSLPFFLSFIHVYTIGVCHRQRFKHFIFFSYSLWMRERRNGSGRDGDLFIFFLVDLITFLEQ
jgi:hypothetical protein